MPKEKMQPVIDMSRCKACGVCIAFCPKEVFEADLMGRPVIKEPGNCSGCLMCDYRCPDFAVTLVNGSPDNT